MAGLRKELVGLEKRKEAASDEIEALKRQRLAGLETELEAKRREFEQSCQKERDKLEGQARAGPAAEVLSKNLAKVSAEMAEKRDELVNQFLAISPLLSQLNLFAAAGPRESATSVADSLRESEPRLAERVGHTQAEARPSSCPPSFRPAPRAEMSARSVSSSASASTSRRRVSSTASWTWPPST